MKFNTIEPGVLKVYTYSGFAPVCFCKDDKPAGKDISFLTAFAADHGMKVEFTVLPYFDGIWRTPGEDFCDIAAAGISPWKERKDQSPGVVWTIDYFHVRRSLLIRARDRNTFRTIADFANGIIASTAGSSADLDVEKRKPASTLNLHYNVQEAAVRDLLAGSIDAFAEGDVSNLYLAIDRPLVLTDVHELDPDVPESFSFPVREASGIVGDLNDWIRSRPKDEYLKIQV
jgi:ABC-type amino acid transport substrate-binding protein